MFGKNRPEIEDRNNEYDLTNLQFGATLFCIKIYYAITACMIYAFAARTCCLIENGKLSKRGLFVTFLYNFTRKFEIT